MDPYILDIDVLKISVAFMWKDESKNTTDIFTPQNLRTMCEFESMVTAT